MSASASLGEEAVAGEKRKRLRAARACENCRTRKYKCDEQQPCSSCERTGRDCVYEGAAHAQRIRSLGHTEELEAQVRDLTARLEEAQRQLQNRSTASSQLPRIYPLSNGTATQDCERHGNGHEPPAGKQTLAHEHDEFIELNRHTRSLEYFGNTSSMAFLAYLQSRAQEKQHKMPKDATNTDDSVVNKLFNTSFTPKSPFDHRFMPVDNDEAKDSRCFFRTARVFVQDYFATIHYICPILDRSNFLERCEDLWFNRGVNTPKPFIALYYSVCSLGALVGARDPKHLEGMDRFEWSRKLYNYGTIRLGELAWQNDLDVISCLILMTQVCQHEMNLHMAYLHTGLAIRICISAGYHRRPRCRNDTSPPSDFELKVARIWWTLYQLESETSFMLGRPDSLGLSSFYNCIEPPLDGSEHDFITHSIQLAQIIRQVSATTNTNELTLEEYQAECQRFDRELDAWYGQVEVLKEDDPAKILKIPQWHMFQRGNFLIRFYNIKMIMYRPFLMRHLRDWRLYQRTTCREIDKCLDNAILSLETLHKSFAVNPPLRSWFYITIFILYDATIVLSYATYLVQRGSRSKTQLLGYVNMSIDLLEAMEGCTVANRAVEVMKLALSRAEASDDRPEQTEMIMERAVDKPAETTTVDEANAGLQEAWFSRPVGALSTDPLFVFDDPDFSFLLDNPMFQ